MLTQEGKIAIRAGMPVGHESEAKRGRLVIKVNALATLSRRRRYVTNRRRNVNNGGKNFAHFATLRTHTAREGMTNVSSDRPAFISGAKKGELTMH